MREFDVKYAAYERAMQQNNYFGLKGDAIGEQLGRQSLALQEAETKAADKAKGKARAKQIAMERNALNEELRNAVSGEIPDSTIDVRLEII